MPDEAQSWHLDKRVPVALIFTLLMQFAAGVWFLSVAFKDIESNRNGMKNLDGRMQFVERNAGTQAVQLGRIEESVSGMRNDINRLINMLDRRTP
jgi:hypothetical protein